MSKDALSDAELKAKAEEATQFLLALSMQQPDNPDHDYVNAPAPKKKLFFKNRNKRNTKTEYVDAEMMKGSSVEDYVNVDNITPPSTMYSAPAPVLHPKAPLAAPRNSNTAAYDGWQAPNATHSLSDHAKKAKDAPQLLSRKEAEKILVERGCQDGDFVVRLSDKVQDGYVITSVHTKSLWHAVLKMQDSQLSYKNQFLGETLEEALTSLQTRVKIEDNIVNRFYFLKVYE
eukprot:m.30222 g.30222  ORF g.30222 m.30222 type:complete len:231 (+) comp16236_c0_seq1:195-887(+)